MAILVHMGGSFPYPGALASTGAIVGQVRHSPMLQTTRHLLEFDFRAYWTPAQLLINAFFSCFPLVHHFLSLSVGDPRKEKG